MARSPSESRTSSSSPMSFPDAPAPFPEARQGSAFRSQGTAPGGQGPSSSGQATQGRAGTGPTGTGPNGMLPAAPVAARASGTAPGGHRGTAASRADSIGPMWTAAFSLGACAVVAALAAAAIGASHSKPGAAVAAVAAVAALVMLIVLVTLRHRYGAAAAEREEHEAQLHERAVELERAGYERQMQYNGTLNALGEAVDHLVRVQLPAALNGSAPSQPLPDSASGNGEAAALFGRVTTAVADGAAKLRSQLDDQIEASRLAVVTLARRVQASAHRIQEEATRMAARHPADSDVLESSMRVDHASAQQARHAQSVAVLCGEWPGQQWPQPLPLLDVVRAASSRIVAYRRVTVSGEPDTAATASAVEPLIHLIAELLANATQSSPPTTQVLVTVRTVQRGAVIEMDDGGVGMEEHQLEQAREIVSGQKLLRLGDLGEIPQTGMAVIGQYVHRHGFRVDLMPSPYGGVRAVVLVPAEMVENLEPSFPATHLPAEAQIPPPAPAPTRFEPVQAVQPARAEPAWAAPAGAAPDSGAAPDTGAAPDIGAAPDSGALPQRRSRRGETDPAPHGTSPAERPVPMQTPEQAGAWMAAYFGGSADGSAASSDEPTYPTDPHGSTDPPDGSADSPVSE